MNNLLNGDALAHETKTMLEDAIQQVYGRDELVTGYEPCTENGEFCYKVQVSNPCLESGKECLTITNIQLMTVAYSSRATATDEDSE